ncbi:lysozyme family protein [Fictibacillus sp. NRS-1165]
MQASESYCGTVGCINNPEKSIQQGTKNFSSPT